MHENCNLLNYNFNKSRLLTKMIELIMRKINKIDERKNKEKNYFWIHTKLKINVEK